MSKWHLTTNPPEKSGEYLVVIRYGYEGLFKEYDAPAARTYSKVYDAWNATDKGGDEFKIADLRECTGKDLHCVYAWYEIDELTTEELDALEVDDVLP